MCGLHFYSIKISEDVRQYAAEHGIAEEEALAKGMEEKSKEFAEAGAEVYVPALVADSSEREIMNSHQSKGRIGFLLQGQVTGMHFNGSKKSEKPLLDFHLEDEGDLRITIEANDSDDDPGGHRKGLTCKVTQSVDASPDQVTFAEALIKNRQMLRVPESLKLPLLSKDFACIDAAGFLSEGFSPRRHQCPEDVELQLNQVEHELSARLTRFLNLMRWQQNCDAQSRLIEHTAPYWSTGDPDFRLAPLPGGEREFTGNCLLEFSYGADDLSDLGVLWADQSLSEPLGHTLLREAATIAQESSRSAFLIMTAGLETAIKTSLSAIAPDTD